ncbi:(p)ppGpp synthetase [Enterobacter sp. Ap-1006]|uniref:GTP pyrophosphokinase n=1 Tax=Enterobacter sp. Ap-1006 TaxID=2608345 RepID=UPI001422B5D6|nr:(p)ppGpp synthetase [Enterobacter sp. Ap-1006]NIF50124.1 (p)ppGpp synthetase [Enterobacter sp. Ap-1006]
MIDHCEEYEKQYPFYVSLMSQAMPVLRKLVEDESVSIFNIEGRVKTIDSLRVKLTRKVYVNPLEEIEDFCGIRIICYYESDLDRIEDIIRKEFDVTSGSDKQKEIDVDRFGYSSRHLICKIKDEWLNVPNYRNLGGFKMEIQVRTMLMHTWAAISHKLLYKREKDAPREIKRSLSKLSALIELADEKFDSIKDLKISYNDRIETQGEVINKDEALNSDNLIKLINEYSPGRKFSNEDIPELLDEIRRYDSTVEEFEKRITQCMPYLGMMEKEESNMNNNSELPMWHIEGFCRSILDLTCEHYYNSRWGTIPEEAIPIITKYRALVKAPVEEV